MKMRDRVLSCLLALALCAGLASPAVLAADIPEVLGDDPFEALTDEIPENPEADTPEDLGDGPEADIPEWPESDAPEDSEADAPDAPEEAVPEPQVFAAGNGGDDITLKYDPNAGDYGRVWLDVASNTVVVDSFTYNVSSDRYVIDEYGYIVLKDGADPANEELSISAEVRYFSGSDVIFADNVISTAKLFETKTNGTANQNYDYQISDQSKVAAGATQKPGQVARTGQYGITCAYSNAKDVGSLQNGAPGKDLGQAKENVTLTAWYYDPVEAGKVLKASNATGAYEAGLTSDTELGLHIDVKTSADSPNRYFMGIAATSNNVDCNTNYYYRASTHNPEKNGDWIKREDGIRSEGWHKMQWIFTSGGMTMKWDDQNVYTDSTLTSLQYIHIANNKGHRESTRDMLQDRHFIDDISVVKNDAVTAAATLTTTVKITVPELVTLSLDGDGELRRDGEQRAYVTGLNTADKKVIIKGVEYTLSGTGANEVELDPKTGLLKVKDGVVPSGNKTVTVTANVTYYVPDSGALLWYEDMEKDGSLIPSGGTYSLSHSGTSLLNGLAASRSGKMAGTPASVVKDGMYSPTINRTGTLVFWYYDPATDEELNANYPDQAKYGMMLNDYPTLFLGVAMPASGDLGPDGNKLTDGNDAYRTTYTYREDSRWYPTNIERTPGWHEFKIVVASTGATLFIDGKPVCKQGETTPINNTSVKSIEKAIFATNWGNKQENADYINNRHFIDDVYILAEGANLGSEKTVTLTSAEIPVRDIEFEHSPKDPTVDSTYPKTLTFDVEPGLDELGEVQLDGEALTAAQWHVTTEADAPKNASYYPTGRLVIDSSVFKGLADGEHRLTLVMISGSTHNIAFTAAANTHVATDYYLSNSGSDSKDGHSAAQAWASFDKLSTVTFGPGDRIYLDAASVWSGVQFQPKGSGAEGKPIVITSYNNGGDSSKRPILNGDGTVANKDTANGGHSYLAFEPWRKFYPSGTIELFNVEYWEVRGIEITNYAATYTQAGTGRNGIAVIHDFFETQGIETLPSGDTASKNKAMEEAFYRAGKLQHIVVEDCYIHDVTGYHPGSGANGMGGKMSGGINVYGPYDGLKLDNNIVMYCDVEGIRNDVLAWRGDTRTQFPCYMEDISVSNNFIVGVPGDGVVISSCIEPELSHNYLTDAGYSYFVPKAGTLAIDTAPKAMGNRQDPIIVDNATNFAGLWVIGTMDAAVEYNESVNNVWTCNDGEAFDADMYTWGTVFQYNYTYRNNGGLCLFMSGNQMDDGNIVRYNVSVQDGEGVGTPNDGRKAVFHYNKEPDAIYNNLFILGDDVRGMFGGGSNTAYFYNNIVIKPDGAIGSFNLNTTSNTNAAAAAMTSKTVMNNNLFYPAAILGNVTGSFTKRDNITPDSLDGIFAGLDGFMEAQPVKALNGRSDLTGTAVTMTDNKGAGVAMSVEAGRSVKTPNGTGFDYAQFEGIKTVEGSPTIGAGIPVKLTIWPQTDKVHPLTTDFFRNSIKGVTTPDIGPYQWSADASHYVKLTLDGNGSDSQIAPLYAKIGGTVDLPDEAPVKTGSTFAGWYENADLSGSPVSGTYTVTRSGITLYAKWEKDGDSCDVTFDTQGGSYVAPLNGLTNGSKVTKPATDPTKEGCRFLGWYKDAEGTEAWDFDDDTVTADTVIYAKWQVRYYTVTFNRNGGDTQPDPSTKWVMLPAASLGSLPTPPTRSGYVFLGWNTADDGSGTAFNGGTRISGNITVYAQWRPTGAYIVTFNSSGGSDIAPENVAEGESVGRPANPTRSGYTFGGWYTDPECTDGSEYDFNAAVNANIILYAKWTQSSGSGPSVTPGNSGNTSNTGKPDKPGDGVVTTVKENEDGSTTTTVTDNKTGTVTVTTEQPDGSMVETFTAADDSVTITATNPEGEELAKVVIPAELPTLETGFVDVPAGHWAEDGINKIAALGVVNGVGDNLFNMTDGIKRGDLATILFRMSNGKKGYPLQFSDVPKDKYYADGIAWAARVGVVTGLSADMYAPEAVITREQLATMLYRYAKLLGLNTAVSGSALDSFADKDSVHSWANDGMAWCVSNGIIKGKDNNTLVPGAEASRAETAVMLSRFIELIK